ncbi:hypothetical protein AWM68_16905 [Fictibacillus phosphorivorans]|uniref:Uncharacterized protein n=1 Tax=Fictibacillus phosphorivorans TaxID=1221500 RepID=A0A161RVB3_9BACL|nr:hypothetical protein [Fictibacillus phosphorivorans]KZE68270.1 hypothetical protein AWM68_16905 [Fictibacillus phosphorivorans]
MNKNGITVKLCLVGLMWRGDIFVLKVRPGVFWLGYCLDDGGKSRSDAFGWIFDASAERI